jgi:RHS repeat-associated protein
METLPDGDASGQGLDRVEFATYTRDSYTGFDYADQRFYASTYGRFLTPDRKGGNSTDPVSMNRYAYVGGDPVNRIDPQGTDCVFVNGGWCSALDSSGGCYDPGYGDPESGGGGGGGCPSVDPNVIMALEQSSLGPTLAAEAAAMGCYGAPIITVAQSSGPPAPNCNAIVAAVGFSGLTYSNALQIWNDGSLSGYSTDGTAATIAALGAVTWQGESSFQTNPINNGNTNSQGVVTSTDYGPFQINQKFHPNPNLTVWGTNGAGQPFNGNVNANITFGISILEGLYNSYGNNAAGRYVGSLGNFANGTPINPNAQKREATWNQWSTSLINLFSNTYCFTHQ